MPAWAQRLRAAVAARPGWSWAALACALASLACLPADRLLQAEIRAWDTLPGIPALFELCRPFGRGEVAVLIALLIAAAGRRRRAGELLIALALSALLAWAFKIGIGRERPNGQDFSFVSGDASTFFALLPFLVRAPAALLGGILLGSGVALARVVFGYHWVSDVLLGASVGIVSATIAPLLMPRAWPWRHLADRRLWLAVAAAAWIGAVVWALVDREVGWLRTFLLVFAPAALAWAALPRLRLAARHGLWPRPWQFALGLGVALLALACATGLWDRDEPRNAHAAQEMVATGSWLVPTFDGEPRMHKPILPYWLMAAALRTGLPPDIACRLPAVLCMALAVWLLAGAIARLVPGDRRAPAMALAVLASSPLVLVSGSAATTDAALVLGIAATMRVLLASVLDGPRWWHAPAAGLAIGWALLAKGPMALVVPVGAVAALALARWSVVGRGLVTWRAWAVAGGAILFGASIALAWLIPADRATGGAMVRELIGNHVIERALRSRESHGGPPFYYLPVLLVACIAWLPALFAAARGIWPAQAPERRTALVLLAWFAPGFVVISLAQTKLPHYLLPMLWPAAALLAIAALRAEPPRWWEAGVAVQRRLLGLAGGALVSVPVAATVLQAAGWLRLPLPVAPLVPAGMAAGLSLLVLATAAHRRPAPHAAGAVVGIAALVAALALNGWRVEAWKPAEPAARAVRSAVAPGVPVSMCGYAEPSFHFYLGAERGPVGELASAGELRAWLDGAGPAVMVATRARLREAGGHGPGVREIKSIAGYNYSNGRFVELVVLVRR